MKVILIHEEIYTLISTSTPLFENPKGYIILIQVIELKALLQHSKIMNFFSFVIQITSSPSFKARSFAISIASSLET
jgi:hypothetical protein